MKSHRKNGPRSLPQPAGRSKGGTESGRCPAPRQGAAPGPRGFSRHRRSSKTPLLEVKIKEGGGMPPPWETVFRRPRPGIPWPDAPQQSLPPFHRTLTTIHARKGQIKTAFTRPSQATTGKERNRLHAVRLEWSIPHKSPWKANASPTPLETECSLNLRNRIRLSYETLHEQLPEQRASIQGWDPDIACPDTPINARLNRHRAVEMTETKMHTNTT